MPKAKRRKAPVRRLRRRKPQRTARALQVALAGLAHDIRTPLTGVLALADLLGASDLPQRERRWAAAIKETAEHLTRLTTSVVDATRAASQGLALQNEPFSARELVQSVAAAMVARAESKGLRSKVTIARGLPDRVRGDAVRLRSALENLIDNAVKFTARGGIALKVTAKRAARGRARFEFAVTDSGIGISARDLKRLFRPFAQANDEIARRYGGSGLGLSLVKRIALAMGGDVTVRSVPGRSSTFRLAVNLEVADRTGRGGSRRQLRVLCVDDNPYSRIVLKAVLDDLGHHAEFAGSGEDAIDAIRRKPYDALLIELALPGISGFETARRIRRLRSAARRVPIFAVSGSAGDNNQAAARAAGLNAYLGKPVAPAALADALAAIGRVRRV